MDSRLRGNAASLDVNDAALVVFVSPMIAAAHAS